MFDSRRLRAPTTIVFGFPDIIAIIMDEKMIVSHGLIKMMRKISGRYIIVV